MTPIVVVDASALAAVAFQEPEGRAIRDRLENRSLAAPHLLAYELVNTALTKLRRHPAKATLIRAGLAGVLADDFAIFWSDVDHRGVLDLAEKTGLTAYDAAYLWLARHLDAELVTLDTELQRAAKRR
jgi:predicted nucleic acid-binding protein